MNERVTNKKQRLKEIKGLVLAFCEEHLNEELAGYALKLCESLGRKRKISITRGKKEIWAAAIVLSLWFYFLGAIVYLFVVKTAKPEKNEK